MNMTLSCLYQTDFARLHKSNQKLMNFHQPPDLDFSITFQVVKKRAFLITKTIDFDRFFIEIRKS